MKKTFLAAILTLVLTFSATGCTLPNIFNNDSSNQPGGITQTTITNNYTVNINVADVGETEDKPLTTVLEEICRSRINYACIHSIRYHIAPASW